MMTTSGAGRRGLLAPVPDGPMLKEPLIGEDQTAAKAKWLALTAK